MSDNEQSKIDKLEALAAEILQGLQETKAIANSNARAIEALSGAMAEDRRKAELDRARLYQVMAQLATAQADFYQAQANFAQTQAAYYNRLEEADQRQETLSRRQGEIVEILKILAQKEK